MTETVDPVRAFRHHLGRDLDTRLNTTQAVTALVRSAVTNHGWNPKQLANQCGRDLNEVVNAGAAQHATRAWAVRFPRVLIIVLGER